jgi:hypothetical protein
MEGKGGFLFVPCWRLQQTVILSFIILGVVFVNENLFEI